MDIVKLNIEAESQLAEALSDFLIGVMQAVVEFSADDNSSTIIVHAFIQEHKISLEQIKTLEEKVANYCLEMAEIFHLPVPVVTSELIPDQDWSKKWKEHFQPFEIIPNLIIAPSWASECESLGQQVIVMDPGMAFGTGHHATTRLCLEMMELADIPLTNTKVLDVGTGTGVLGMAAVLLGAPSAVGIDVDEDAVMVAHENILKNGLQERMTVSCTSLENINGKYQLVFANIIHDVLLELADGLARVTDEGGLLILSGLIYGPQTQSIIESFQKRYFSFREEKQDGEWGALMFVKAGGVG